MPIKLSPPRQRIAIYETALLKIANGEVKDLKREALLALQEGTKIEIRSMPYEDEMDDEEYD